MFDPEVLGDVFFYSALIGGGVLLLQIGMMILGVDDGGLGDIGDAGGIDVGDVDIEAEGATDGSGFWFFEMISIRTVAAAAAFFGSVGGITLKSGQSTGVALILACLAGYAAMYAVYWVFKQIIKLETSGALDIRNALDAVGEVYVPIDPGTAGKIHVQVQGRTIELQARSDCAERLATGQKVTVTEVLSGDTVKVDSCG